MENVLISVIVPVYNTDPKYITETLLSIVNQTLDKSYFEIIIVNDFSTNKDTLLFLNEIQKNKDYLGVQLKVINHKKNMWLVEARKTGAKYAKGEYFCFLDSDDLIEKDYLKKALTLIQTSSNIGWVYPSVKGFGQFDYFVEAQDFNIKKLFFENFCATPSLFKKNAWFDGQQREVFITDRVRIYEDWDMLLRIVQKGWYGQPLKDSKYFYRQGLSGLSVRDYKINALSKYIMWRKNIFYFLTCGKARQKFLIDLKKGFCEGRFAFSTNPFLGKIFGPLIKKIFYFYPPNTSFPLKMFLFAVLFPEKFKQHILTSDLVLTRAEAISKFKSKPKLKISPPRNTDLDNKKGIFFHPYWTLGGAEIVMLNWIKSFNSIKGAKSIDVVLDSAGDYKQLKKDFQKYCSEQHALDKIGSTPLQNLNYLWNLLVLERPKIVFIYANSLCYILTPYIKKYFPDMVIIDILHLEEGSDPSWFSTSNEYQKYIDKRIVVSEAWKEVLIKKYNEDPKKISVFNNFIDTDKFNPKLYNKRKIRKELGIPTDKIVVGFLGRLNVQKNPWVVVDLAKLMRKNENFCFIIVGDGDQREKIKEYSRDCTNLIFFDEDSSPAKYYAACDVMVFPSLYEGYPLVGIESAAMNVPIIATDVIGFREQIRKGKFGVLYSQSGDNFDDAEKISNILLKDYNNLVKMGKNGRKFAIKNHSMQNKKQYDLFLKNICAQK